MSDGGWKLGKRQSQKGTPMSDEQVKAAKAGNFIGECREPSVDPKPTVASVITDAQPDAAGEMKQYEHIAQVSPPPAADAIRNLIVLVKQERTTISGLRSKLNEMAKDNLGLREKLEVRAKEKQDLMDQVGNLENCVGSQYHQIGEYDAYFLRCEKLIEACKEHEKWHPKTAIARALNGMNEFQPNRKVSSIPCARCGGPVVEFSVGNETWNMMVRLGGPERDDEYMCEACFRKCVEDFLGSTQGQQRRPLKCAECGEATGPLHPIDADHTGWVCPKCYEKLEAKP